MNSTQEFSQQSNVFKGHDDWPAPLFGIIYVACLKEATSFQSEAEYFYILKSADYVTVLFLGMILIYRGKGNSVFCSLLWSFHAGEGVATTTAASTTSATTRNGTWGSYGSVREPGFLKRTWDAFDTTQQSSNSANGASARAWLVAILSSIVYIKRRWWVVLTLTKQNARKHIVYLDKLVALNRL